MSAFIYTLSHPLTGEIRYVGKTNDPKKRLNAHIFREDYHARKTSWIKGLLKDGLKPVMDVIEETADDAWQEAERFYITYFRFLGLRLVNGDNGGRGAGRVSVETKAKLSAFRKGKKLSPEVVKRIADGHRGKPRSQAFIDKVRLALTGRKRPPEVVEKMRIGNIGRKQPPEAVAKTAAANRGRKHTEEWKARMSALNKKRYAENPMLSQQIRARTLGVKRSPETCRKLSEWAKRRYESGFRIVAKSTA